MTEDSWKTEKKFEENHKDKEIGPNEVKYNCHNIVLEIQVKKKSKQVNYFCPISDIVLKWNIILPGYLVFKKLGIGQLQKLIKGLIIGLHEIKKDNK